MVSRIDYSPQAPGPDMSSRYPIAPGPNYQKWKEQKGFIYDPYHDRYVADPKAQQELAYSQGLAERPKEPPGLFESLAPVAGVGTALYGGKWLGEHGFDKISGLFGGGEVAKQGAAQAAGTGSGIAGGFVESAGANGFSPVGMDAANYFPEQGMFDLSGIGSAGNVILPAAGAYGAYDVLTGDYGTGRNALQGAASGAAMGSYFGPQGALIGGGIGLGAGLLKGMFDHESTRDLAKKHTSQLLDKSDDPAYQSYVSGMREQFNSGPSDPSKPYHGGQYGSWEEYKKAGLDAADLTGVYGNIKTFGPEWAKLSEDQRRSVTQGVIDAGLYSPNKGEVEITDSAKAKDIFNQIIKQGQAPQGAAPAPQAKPQGNVMTFQPGPTGMIDPSKATPVPRLPNPPVTQPKKKYNYFDTRRS